jgi:phosphinothricin acetyltransferase
VLSKNLPYLVLEDGSALLGFAYCNWFKPRPAYRFSAEDSIYLAPEAAGKGYGRLLLVELMAQAERAGVRKLLAVIGDSQNQGSIGVHRSCGFTHIGVMRSCGWKFDRWLDVVLMERSLGLGDTSAPAP